MERSLSQNRFLRMIPTPSPKSNQDRIVRAQGLMSSDPSRPSFGLPHLPVIISHFTSLLQEGRKRAKNHACLEVISGIPLESSCEQ